MLKKHRWERPAPWDNLKKQRHTMTLMKDVDITLLLEAIEPEKHLPPLRKDSGSTCLLPALELTHRT